MRIKPEHRIKYYGVLCAGVELPATRVYCASKLIEGVRLYWFCSPDYHYHSEFYNSLSECRRSALDWHHSELPY